LYLSSQGFVFKPGRLNFVTLGNVFFSVSAFFFVFFFFFVAAAQGAGSLLLLAQPPVV